MPARGPANQRRKVPRFKNLKEFTIHIRRSPETKRRINLRIDSIKKWIREIPHQERYEFREEIRDAEQQILKLEEYLKSLPK